MKKSKKLLASLLIISGLTGCKYGPESWLCTIIIKPEIEKSYSFCVHQRTKEEKEVPIQEMHKWIASDVDSYQAMRAWYKQQCDK